MNVAPFASSFRGVSLLLMGLGLAACNKDGGGFVVFDNEPIVSILAPEDGATFHTGEPITFRARVADDGPYSELNLEWSSDIDGVLQAGAVPDADGNLELTTGNLTGGTHVISLRAVDISAGVGEDFVGVNIDVVPELPSITIEHPVDGERGLEGQNYVFSANVSDNQDNPELMSVELVANPGGVICYMVPDGKGHVDCTAILENGPYLLTFTVIDTDKNEASASAEYAVVSRADYDADGDGYTPNQADCDDANPTVYPTAPELCDELDNDCNEFTEIDAGTECFDDDGDGFCEAPPCANTDSKLADCDDDSAPYVNPDAVEERNDIDDDCNGKIDDHTTAYDDDNDGYCEEPPCINSTSGTPDCDDDNYAVKNGAKEVCGDGIDNDCDTLLNEKDASGCRQFYVDNDGDTYGTGSKTECWCDDGSYPYTATNNKDCNDNDAGVNPNSTAEVRNGVDDNCNGKIDEGTSAYDDDADGYCEEPPCINSTKTQPDCDDGSYTVKPGATEVCGDSLDNDCDGLDNEKNAQGCKSFSYDGDGDGYGTTTKECWCAPGANGFTSSTTNDCNDNNAGVNPGTTSETLNGLDDNCNGKIDEGTVVYDDDGDGYCESPPCVNSTKTQPDCNDGSYTIKPGATEVCGDNIDNDCDTLLNEQNAQGCKSYYADNDADGYGASNSKECWCDPGVPGHTTTNSTDCYDANALAKPGQTAYFTDSRGDGSFDYNCSGTQDKQFTTRTGGCVGNFSNFECGVNTVGWVGSVPNCGVGGSYLDDCGQDVDIFCTFTCSGANCLNCIDCEEESFARTQTCR